MRSPILAPNAARRLGDVASWSRCPSWIVLHDPLNGEWHEVKASECLPRVVAEAGKHREQGGRRER